MRTQPEREVDQVMQMSIEDYLGSAIGITIDVEFVEERDRQLGVAEGYSDLGMFGEALEVVERLERWDAEDLFVLETKLDLLMALGRWKEALMYGEVLTEIQPEEMSHHKKYAIAAHSAGRTELAIEILFRARSECDDGSEERSWWGCFWDIDCDYLLAGYEMVAGTRDAALGHLKTAVRVEPAYRAKAAADPLLRELVLEIPEFLDECPDFLQEEPLFLSGAQEDLDAFDAYFGKGAEGDFSSFEEDDDDCPF